jgi:multidrug efflux pump subunit AcrB
LCSAPLRELHPSDTILSTLPSAGVGAVLASMLCDTELRLSGVILLIGLVKKNAVIMFAFALDAERTKCLASQQPIHEACLLPFRPMMTASAGAVRRPSRSPSVSATPATKLKVQAENDCARRTAS